VNKKLQDELMAKRQAREEGRDPYATEEPPSEDDRRLDDIHGRAQVVRAAHDAYKEAIMTERNNAAEILKTAVRFIAPALSALVGKIEIERVSAISLRDGKTHSETTTLVPFGQKGVLLIDRFTVVEDTPESGAYQGSGLYLLEHGAFYIGTRTGVWSRKPGTRAELKMYMSQLTREAVLERYRIDDVLDGLVRVLVKQEALADAAERVRARAELLAVTLDTLRSELADSR
jgi:hypothetical protein